MMKFTLVVVLALCVVCHASQMPEEEYQLQFTKWMNAHSKSYTSENLFKRYNIFRDNLDLINEHNAGNHTYTLGTNEFSDLTTQEWTKRMFGSSPSAEFEPSVPIVEDNGDGNVTAPLSSIDWSKKGAVTGVKNQSPCGSCWAFSTTGGMEGQLSIHKGSLVSLSEQQLINCISGMTCHSGGEIYHGLDYIKKNGICSESSYSYTGKDTSCRASKCRSVTKVSSYTHMTTEDGLFSHIGKGPISISLGTNTEFHHYKSGVFNHASGCATHGHDVLIVGYGVDNGTNYWKIKNSWGKSWGESGYIRMKRGVKLCGIGHKGYLPIL